MRIDTKCFERGQDNKNGCPAMIEGEGEVDEEFLGQALGRVMLLDDVIDVRDCGADEEGKDKRNDVMVSRPKVDIDGIKKAKEGEAPGYTVNDDSLSCWEELVDNGSE